jgi:hypothetical protein
MNITVKKVDNHLIFNFAKPHKLKELNIYQLKKVWKRAKAFGLEGEVEAELKRRVTKPVDENKNSATI